jgi:hypothetical protein
MKLGGGQVAVAVLLMRERDPMRCVYRWRDVQTPADPATSA